MSVEVLAILKVTHFQEKSSQRGLSFGFSVTRLVTRGGESSFSQTPKSSRTLAFIVGAFAGRVEETIGTVGGKTSIGLATLLEQFTVSISWKHPTCP